MCYCIIDLHPKHSKVEYLEVFVDWQAIILRRKSSYRPCEKVIEVHNLDKNGETILLIPFTYSSPSWIIHWRTTFDRGKDRYEL